jgi:hypothetical protein
VTVVARCPSTYRPEREYVVDLVLSHLLGLEHRIEWAGAGEIELRVDGDPDRRRLVTPDVLLATAPGDWLTERALPRVPLARLDVAREVPELRPRAPVPVLYGGDEGPFVEPLDDGLRVALDVFGSIFHQVTRYEELAVPARDEHGRFPLVASLAHAARFADRAIVNEYVDLLQALMARLWPRLPRIPRRPRLLVTHDVDYPFSVRRRRARQNLRMIGGDVLKRGDPGLAARRLRAVLADERDLSRRDPAFTFDFIMRTGEQLGVQSSFFFLAEPGGRKPANYSLDEPWVRSLLRSIADRGHRLGLHVSYDAYLSPDATRREFETLRNAAEAVGVTQDEWGGRQHWLRWENPTTWRNWEHAGLDYDATVGFEEQPGFRCGVCHPFPVFDVRARRRLRLIEHPLHFMDSTCFDRGASASAAAARAFSIHQTCKRHGGEFVLLWHNDSLASKHRRAAYADLLRQIAP